MQDTEYICKTHVRIIFARHGLCEVPRPVAAVSSPHEGSSPTGVSADGGWMDHPLDGVWWRMGGCWVVERGWRPGDVSTQHQSAHHSPSHDLTTDQNICPVF